MDYETLIVTGDVEARDEDGQRTLYGYAVRFFDGSPGTEFQLWDDGPVERFMPGAFSNFLKRKGDVAAVFNHDQNVVLGRVSNGTLRLTQDDKGLRYEVRPPDTQQARDVMTLVARRDITGSSVQFRVHPNGQQFKRLDGKHVREIRSVANVLDVGPVVHPAYAATGASVRSIDVERIKREFSQVDTFNAFELRARAVQVDARQKGLLQ